MSKTEVKDIIMADEVDAGNRIRRTPSSGPGDVQFISKEKFIHPNEDHISKPRKENRRMSKRFQEATVQSVPSQRGSRTRRNQVSSAQNDPQKLQQLKQELAGVRRELKASQGQLQETYEELRKTRRKLAASQEELTICKDEMFGSQPTTQVPDSRVAKEFENLCQQIVNWVEAEVVVFEKAHPEEGQEHVFSMGEDKEAAQFMAQHPTGGEHLAVYMIHRWLQDNLFGRKLSCIGLPAETIQLLESVEQSMAHLDPPRDSATIATWRSETLKALTSTRGCEITRVRQSQELNGRLFQELSKALPILFGRPQTHDSFYTQILRPAVNLASIIQESTTRYGWASQKGILRQWSPVGKLDLKRHKMVDMKTSKCLRPDSVVTADQQRVIGNVVLMVEPSLRRVNGDRQGNTLRQGTYIMNLKFPLGKSNRTSAWKT